MLSKGGHYIRPVMAVMIVAASLAGCAGHRDDVLRATAQTRQDVFQTVQTAQATPGKALVAIEFPVKTFKARILTTYVKHVDPLYTLIVNIDGQTVELTDEPVLENLPGDFRNNQEAGTGWKYRFRKTLLLEPGTYRIAIAVPLSGVVVEKELNLTAGENLLRCVPAYKSSMSRDQNYPRFSHGLQGISVQLTSQKL